jgi:hypothetical protein
LGQRRLSLDQIGRNMLQEYGPAKAYEMLQGASYVSDFAALDELQFAATQNSYRIVAIDGATRDKSTARQNSTPAKLISRISSRSNF